MPESYVQTNVNVTPGAKMKTFQTVDGGGNVVESEAIALVDAATGTPYDPALESTLQSVDAATTSTALATNAIATEIDVPLSSRASEATLANVLTTAAFDARINTQGQKAMAASTPVVIANDQSTIPVTLSTSNASLQNGAEVVINNVAAQIIAANPNRKGLIIQNTGSNNIRIGAAGVTNVTGTRLTPGMLIAWAGDGTPVNAIFGIREGASNSVALGQEET